MTDTATKKLSEITLDPRLQIRARMDPDTVGRYADLLKAGETLPPLDGFYCQGHDDILLVDGFHRFNAMEMAGIEKAKVRVHRGPFSDALAFAIKANQAHGLPLSNEDKRRALTAALDSDLTSDMSTREIAALCGVHHSTVAAEIQRRSNPTPTSGVSDSDSSPAPNRPQEPVRADRPVAAPEPEASPSEGGVRSIDTLRDPFRMAESQVRECMDEIKALAESEAGAVIKTTAPDHLRQLREVAESLRSCRPEAFCEKCGGAGCVNCGGRGWLPQNIVASRARSRKVAAI